MDNIGIIVGSVIGGLSLLATIVSCVMYRRNKSKFKSAPGEFREYSRKYGGRARKERVNKVSSGGCGGECGDGREGGRVGASGYYEENIGGSFHPSQQQDQFGSSFNSSSFSSNNPYNSPYHNLYPSMQRDVVPAGIFPSYQLMNQGQQQHEPQQPRVVHVHPQHPPQQQMMHPHQPHQQHQHQPQQHQPQQPVAYYIPNKCQTKKEVTSFELKTHTEDFKVDGPSVFVAPSRPIPCQLHETSVSMGGFLDDGSGGGGYKGGVVNTTSNGGGGGGDCGNSGGCGNVKTCGGSSGFAGCASCVNTGCAFKKSGGGGVVVAGAQQQIAFSGGGLRRQCGGAEKSGASFVAASKGCSMAENQCYIDF